MDVKHHVYLLHGLHVQQQTNETAPIPPPPSPFSPFLISLMASMDVKHHVYLLPTKRAAWHRELAFLFGEEKHEEGAFILITLQF